MDGTTLPEHLEWAEWDVTSGLIHIRRQTMLIAAREGSGRDTTRARLIFHVQEKSQLDQVAARTRFAEEARNTPVPPPIDPGLGT